MKLSDFSSGQSKTSQQNSSDDLMEKYNELKDLSHDQLSEKLLAEVARQKREGSFNYNEILNTLESLKGYLPQENYDNMKRILDSLK